MSDVSIIVPMYNSSKYLEKCLDSLINQTLKNIEIIVVNDGSEDNSLELAMNLAKKDKRIKVFDRKHAGLSSTRNYGLEQSNGKYIGFVDSDDYVESNMFEFLLNMSEDNHADIAICGWYLVENDNIRECAFKSERKVLNSEETTDILLNHVSFDNFACNKLFSKELFDDIRFPEGKLLEDLLTIYKLINKSNKTVIDSTPLYYYVLHNNSITNKLHNQVNKEAFNVFIDRKNDLLKMYPKLTKKIKSNYFTASKNYFITSLNSEVREKEFEKERIKDMRKNIKYVWVDKSIPSRVKLSSTLISIFPYLYFKVIK